MCPGAGRGCIAAYCAPSSVIDLHALTASQRRAHYTRASSTSVLFIGAAGRLFPPQVAACGARLSDRIDGRRCPSSLVWDSTTPTDSLLSTFCASHLHRAGHRRPPASSPVCGLSATHLISSRIWIMPRCAFEATRGRGGAPALRLGRRAAARSGGHCRRLISNVLAWRARPSVGSVHPASRPHGAVFAEVRPRCSSATCTRRPGSSGRRRRCTEHAGFTLPCSKHAGRRAYAYIHPVPSHRPHLDRTQLGFHDAVFVLLEQRSAYPPPVSSLRGHGVPRRVADALF
ncbi:hypothetical protein B0H14DRAFT_150041 [Mycena olivaceomarginata]|nr:hypothetical protein B0H14DRAFT_150041 [Mycena olivaceomarginata]